MPNAKNDEFVRKIERIMKDHIAETNFKWNSDVFTSSSIAKIILKKLNEPKTRFRLIHKMVRDILKKWEEQSYCEHIETTHYSHCKKTKMIVQFNRHGLFNMVPEVLPLPV
ncbi:MAG: hypothetical protein ACTSYB_06685 [Candidatus Helarchaeota archaeon]